MALSASTVWEVRIGGSDTANGGGFVTGATGTDYSQQNAPQYSLTGLTSVGAGNIVLTANASADMVGNVLRVTAGTNFTVGWFQITAVSVGVSITVSTNSGGSAITTGAGAAGAAAVGGALLSPGIAASQMAVAGMVAYINNQGTLFSVTNATANVSGGTIAAGAVSLFIGYQTNRNPGNMDTPPTIQTNVSTATLTSGATNSFFNIIFDGNAQTASKLTSATTTFINCTIKNFNTASGQNSAFIGCAITANSALVCSSPIIAFCESYANTATAISATLIVSSLLYGNTGATTRGAQITLGGVCLGSSFIANGGDGLLIANVGSFHYVENNIFQSNGGFGVNGNSIMISVLNNNSFFNNTSGQVSGVSPGAYNMNPISYTGDAFTNTSGNVYTLNNLAGQGAALRAKALPALFPRGLTADFLDMGAAQHQDTGGGSGMLFIPNLEAT